MAMTEEHKRKMAEGRRKARERREAEQSATPQRETTGSSEQTTEARVGTRRKRRRTAREGHRDILTFNVPEGKVGRWVNDVDQGRNIARFLDLGWEFLRDDGSTVLEVGQDRVDSNREPGSIIKRQVDRDGTVAYAMVIDKDWYDEDQRIKQELVNERERAIYEDLKEEGHYGQLDQRIFTG